MSTTLDITLPFNNGTIGSTSESSMYQGNGMHYTWIGGNNDRKYMSVRLQSNPDLFVVDVFEVDDLRINSPSTTSLSSRAHPEYAVASQWNNNIRLCRLSSTSSYLKVFTNSPTPGGSKHYVIELNNETDHEVTIYDVTASMRNDQRGGLYSHSGSAAMDSARGLHHLYMHHLKQNNVITYESLNSTPYYAFVQRTWDPVTKTLTSKTIVTGESSDTGRDYEPFKGAGCAFLQDYSGTSASVLSDANYYVNLHRYTSPYPSGWESNGYSQYLNGVTGRDGKIHFSLGFHSSNSAWGNMQGMWSYQRYVLTYDPVEDDWGLTSRYAQYSELNGNNDLLRIWLPLNTMDASEYAPELDIENHTYYRPKTRHAKTWISCGSDMVRVVGSETGGEITINESAPDVNGNRALQAMWLDFDHFMVVHGDSISSNNVVSRQPSKIRYSILRYYDENMIKIVSEGTVNSGFYSPFLGQNIFNKVDDYTLVSDAFSRVTTFFAPEDEN